MTTVATAAGISTMPNEPSSLKKWKGGSIKLSKPTKCNDNPLTSASSSNSRIDVANNFVRRRQNVPSKKPKENMERWESVGAAMLHTSLPTLMDAGVMVTLIFGGCCANVFALEAIIIDAPASGPLITFSQFSITTLLMLPHFFSLSAGPRSFFLSRRAVPLRSWLIYSALFMTVNLLNNSAFAFKISVPLHIILRSGGPVASMVIGYLYNSKSYTPIQVIAVVLLTSGVVGAALADTNTKGKSLDIGLEFDRSGLPLGTSLTGFILLGLAMILSAFQGVYADRLYQVYGHGHWREALFYSHVLSLPFLIPSYPKLLPQLRTILSSPPAFSTFSTTIKSGDIIFPSGATSIPCPVSTKETITASRSIAQPGTSLLLAIPALPLLQAIFSQIPLKAIYLLLNALTQYLCIRGVYLLSAKSSSLTVTIVLNIRKLVSLIVSIYMFGNVMTTGVLLSAAVVFTAGGIYGFEGARIRKAMERREG